MRTNLQIKVGTYTGNGVDATNIAGVGFRPDIVIVKGGANIAVMRIKEMVGDTSAILVGSTANAADCIQEILNDGFQVGTDAKVNANETTYYYIAMRGLSGQNHFRTGRYVGDGTDNRNYAGGGLNFTPDIVLLKVNSAANATLRTSAMIGDTSSLLTSSANAANLIQSLISNGFQVGSSSQVNANAVDIFFLAMKLFPGVIAVGSYIGNGVDSRAITGIGFQPNVVIIKGDTAQQGCFRTSDIAGDSALLFGAAAESADRIQSLDIDGFIIGTAAPVNSDTVTYYWIALRAGNFNAPVVRTAA